LAQLGSKLLQMHTGQQLLKLLLFSVPAPSHQQHKHKTSLFLQQLFLSHQQYKHKTSLFLQKTFPLTSATQTQNFTVFATFSLTSAIQTQNFINNFLVLQKLFLSQQQHKHKLILISSNHTNAFSPSFFLSVFFCFCLLEDLRTALREEWRSFSGFGPSGRGGGFPIPTEFAETEFAETATEFAEIASAFLSLTRFAVTAAAAAVPNT
jgi:hypothetical protein